MGSRCVASSLTQFVFCVVLLESFQFGEIVADSQATNIKRFRVRREATPTERSRVSCCCGGAVYKATFISKWNKTTHPKDYPENLAHFSTVIGGTHADKHVIWEVGSKASPAVKRFTEWGDTRSLLNKLSRKKYLGIIKIGPIMKSNKPFTDRFRADKHHHYLSMISKIKPSPDWFVGVDRFNLCNDSDCSWKNNITIQLGPIDAGTDSGLKFKAPNLQSQPTQAIYEIKPNVPDHPAASFYNREQQHIPPMAEFKIELVHTKGRCSRNTGPKIDCDVSSWSSWSRCSDACLKTRRGKKTRNRVVITPPRNGGRKCPKTTRTKSCRGKNCTRAKVDCVVSKWSDWSRCSKSCGRGRRTRVREIVKNPRQGGKRCPPLKERLRCRMKRCPVLDCKVSEWSEWHACSKTCGRGRRQRSRTLVQGPTKGGLKCPNLKERQYCNTFECRGRSKLSSISG